MTDLDKIKTFFTSNFENCIYEINEQYCYGGKKEYTLTLCNAYNSDICYASFTFDEKETMIEHF